MIYMVEGNIRIKELDPHAASEAEAAALNLFDNRMRAEQWPQDPTKTVEETMGNWRFIPEYLDLHQWAAWSEDGKQVAGRGCVDLDALGHNTVDYLNLFVQAARHAFADRYRYLGDWEHVPVPLRGLLSAEYNRELARSINLRTASVAAHHEEEPWVHYLDQAAHDPWKYDPAGPPAQVFHPAADKNNESTTHFNVVDRWRNAVSCTHTGVFTDGANPPSTGVYLVGGMAWFIPKPGYANSIAGWKRPLNNQCPVMVFRDGRPVLCQGSPGARRIMNRGVQVVTNVIVFGMGPQEAINQPTVDASGKDTLINARISDEVVGGLRRLGHQVELVEEAPSLTGAFSRPSAITIDYEEGLLRAGVDSFRPTMAIGY